VIPDGVMVYSMRARCSRCGEQAGDDPFPWKSEPDVLVLRMRKVMALDATA
jgi:hypothetical protein